MNIRRWIVASALTLMPQAAHADTFYVASLTGGQVVPPNASPATGFARLRMNEAETGGTVTIYFSGLLTNSTAIHVHGPAGPGATGPIQLTFSGAGPTSGQSFLNYAFTTPAVSAAQIKAGQWYFDVHTVNSPDGEIRGHAIVDPVLTATLSGTQQLPPNGSTGTGRGWVSLNASETQALVSMEWSGLGSNGLDAHMHQQVPGAIGPIICDFAVQSLPSGFFHNQLCPLTPTQIQQLKRGNTYLDVHSTGLPDGELRGQIERTFSPCDFDGDSRSDQVIVRNTGSGLDWWVRLSNGGMQTFTWGAPTDFAPHLLCPDVDGDGRADATVWRPGAVAVFWSRLSAGGIRTLLWGTTDDDARVTGDYDGDGRDDYTIYRAGTPSTYWIRQSSTDTTRVEHWGAAGDFRQTVPDYDGDGKADFGVQRNAGGNMAVYWRKFSSTGSFDTVFWGLLSDFQQSADYDGDGRTDIALSRTNAPFLQWFVRGSLTGTAVSPYGNGFFFGGSPGDTRATADYDGDRRADIAVWRGASGIWFIQSVKTGLTAVFWGAPGDLPVHSIYWQ